MTFGPLVSTKWLAENLSAPDVKIIDGSWRMPGNGDAVDNYNAQHIPGAVFFDIDAIADRRTDLPHMLPSPAQFAKDVEALGISDEDRIVVYDEKGLFSAARVWWMFRAMGHDNIAVLDGGLPRWLSENRPVTSEIIVPTQTIYITSPKPDLIADADHVRACLNGAETVLDARSAERFAGHAPEPRAGIRSGHMPGAQNMPFASLLEGGALKPAPELSEIFAKSGIKTDTRVITSCGSGVTAAILSLALEVIGSRTHAVYDGSWSEWGADHGNNELFPVITDAEGE